MKQLLFIFVLLPGIIISPSYANPSEKNTAIKKMFRIMGIDNQINGGFEAMLPAVDQLASKLQLDAKEKEELKNIYRDWFDNDIDRDAMKREFIKIYAEAFSENEINQLINFYQSPVGQKFLKKSPELMRLGAQIGMQEGQSKEQLLIERLRPFFDKHKKQ